MIIYLVFVYLFIYFSYFQLLDKLSSQVSRPFSPPVRAFSFLSRTRFSMPTARRFSSNVANSRFRVFRESIFAQEKAPTTNCARGGLELAQLTYSYIAGMRMTCYTTGATGLLIIDDGNSSQECNCNFSTPRTNRSRSRSSGSCRA